MIRDRDVNAAYTLVAAGVLLPEYKANFATSGKRLILERMVDMPGLTLEDVVQGWIEGHGRSRS